MTIRANAVEVAKLLQARCRISGCTWRGPGRDNYQEANADRQVHLDWHREHESGA